MAWSNEVLAEEEKWFKEMKQFHLELETEIAENLLSLEVDENGVLTKIPKEEKALFDEDKVIEELVKKGKKMLLETFAIMGQKAIEEAVQTRMELEPFDNEFIGINA